jgi:hypothetical protein
MVVTEDFLSTGKRNERVKNGRRKMRPQIADHFPPSIFARSP